MPLVIPKMPAAVKAALAKGLPRFAVPASAPVQGAKTAERAKGPSARPSISKNAPDIARALEAALAGSPGAIAAPVHVMGLKALAAGKSPRTVKPQMWTQILPEGSEGARAIADVDLASGRIAALSEGPTIRAMALRVTSLQSEKSADSAKLELAMIRVPALHLTALWLKGAAGKADDIVIPNEGPIAPLLPGTRYKLAEFQAIVRKMADERLKMVAPTSGG